LLRILEHWPTHEELAAASRDEIEDVARKAHHPSPQGMARPSSSNVASRGPRTLEPEVDAQLAPALRLHGEAGQHPSPVAATSSAEDRVR
jgi:hypothetical protein